MNKKGIAIQGLIIGFLLVGLFAFCLLQFGDNLSSKNGANQSILDNEDMGRIQATVQNNSNKINQSAEALKKAMDQEGFSAVTLFLVFKSLPPTLFAVLVNTFKLPLQLIEVILSSFGLSPDSSQGGSTLVILLYTFILTTIAIVIGFGVWRVLKVGN